MNTKNNHRKNLRLKNWNYSNPGYYYLTLCTKNRLEYFVSADITNMISNTWLELNKKYPDVTLDEFVIMPNHIHGIIQICPSKSGSTLRSTPTKLGMMICWFKTMSTNYYIQGVKRNYWTPIVGQLWQRNYYEHIIRNEYSLNLIRKYIKNNPAMLEKERVDT